MRPAQDRPEEEEGTINPGVARAPQGTLYLLPRLVGRGNYSRIGLARVLYDPAGEPLRVERQGTALEPREPYELHAHDGRGGCEDPRVTFIPALGLYLLVYAAWGEQGSRLAVSTSSDLRTWRRLGPVGFAADSPDLDAFPNKDGMFFPSPILAPDGQLSLALLHRPMYSAEQLPPGLADARMSIWISYCPLEEVRRDLRALCRPRMHRLLLAPNGPWEGRYIGGGAPPLETPLGWLLIYHGVRDDPAPPPTSTKPLIYSACVAILDRHDPLRVVYRSPSPLLSPATPHERSALGPGAVFPTGIDARPDGALDLYYGMGDRYTGVARLQVPTSLPMLA